MAENDMKSLAVTAKQKDIREFGASVPKLTRHKVEVKKTKQERL